MMMLRRFVGHRLFPTSNVNHWRLIKTCPTRFSQLSEAYSEAYVYKERGDPAKVLHRSRTELPAKIESGDVLVKMLASPINPADINMIQGVYPLKPQLPAVGGNEGVGEIIKVGASVRNLKPGDWIIPSFSGWGTWRTFAVCPSTDVIRIPNDIPLISAATLSVNSCTAYRLLMDFVHLTGSNDVVIQNGANSGVGQAVIQIAASLSIKTINIVRNRPNLDQLVKTLTSLGATHVVTDEFVRSEEMRAMLKLLPALPKLALNCVGGKSSADMLKCMSQEGVMVTYGGMSKQPLLVPAGSLIFSDLRLRGFWMTRWNQMNRDTEMMTEMWSNLVDLVKRDQLKPPLCRLLKFDQLPDGVIRSMQPLISEKQIVLL